MRSGARLLLSAIAGVVIANGAFCGSADADLVVGGTGSQQSYPFHAYTGDFQQIYSSGAFAGPLTIDSIGFKTFFASYAPFQGPETVKFTLSLSTTSASLDAINPDPSANRGADFTTVFSGAYTFDVREDGTFDWTIPTQAFHYDPAKGNLLVDLDIKTPAPDYISFVAGNTNDISRVYHYPDGTTPTNDLNVHYGVQTDFNAKVTPTPEPSTLALAGIGALVVLGYRGRRRIATNR